MLMKTTLVKTGWFFYAPSFDERDEFVQFG